MIKIKKKGDSFYNNFITTVVAVVGLALLIFAIAKLYGNFANQESKNAQKNLENLLIKINAVEDGQKSSTLLVGPNDHWFLASWKVSEPGRPEKCYAKDCICICKYLKEDIGSLSLKSQVAALCKDNGVCKTVDKNIVVFQHDINAVYEIQGGQPSWREGIADPKNFDAFMSGKMDEKVDFPYDKASEESFIPFINLAKNALSVIVSRTGELRIVYSEVKKDIPASTNILGSV